MLFRSVPRDPALHSVLLSPLMFESEVIAVLAIFTDKPHRFDNDEKRLCAALASLGAVALQNARLYARVFGSGDPIKAGDLQALKADYPDRVEIEAVEIAEADSAKARAVLGRSSKGNACSVKVGDCSWGHAVASACAAIGVLQAHIAA